MTQEEKQLLLIDICARLPYEVKCRIDYDNEEDAYLGVERYADDKIVSVCVETEEIGLYNASEYFYPDEIKPYLRPISSLTSDECDRLFEILNINEKDGDWLKINDIGVLRLFTENGKDFYEIADAMDYLYSIHVDFRDMIEKGLALEAPEGMYRF